MAGMFYSSQEAAQKLNVTEERLKELVTEGKLREFRDGPNLLFKVEEVDALTPEEDIIGLEEAPEGEASESDGVELEAETPAEETPEPEPQESGAAELEAIDTGTSHLETPEGETPEIEEAELPPMTADATGTSEILLAPETGAPVMPSDLTDADTALTGMGTSVLGETDREDYEITDDTLAETAVPTGTTPEVPLEEIEEDVNLDSFGSGSGLLDLSLQADDTSLGGILDEIYTAEGEGPEPAAAEAESPGAEMAAPAEQMASEDELAVAQVMPEISPLAGPVIEVPPDAQSNTLGMLLFLPLIIVIYTTVVVVAGFKGVIPGILATVQSFIWYIMGAAAVVTVLVVGAAFMLTGERGTRVKKEKKPKVKKVKEPKVKAKKEKKPKKPKKVK
ncbi:MAG: helix-turn-helix domain-containing protein [Sedimentisphaerales bacterium]|jgi:excisionase family DNA binding protein